jgi:hypothetical protein
LEKNKREKNPQHWTNQKSGTPPSYNIYIYIYSILSTQERDDFILIIVIVIVIIIIIIIIMRLIILIIIILIPESPRPPIEVNKINLKINSNI